MVDQSIDEEEALLISGLKLDQADCYTLDDENDQEFSLNWWDARDNKLIY